MASSNIAGETDGSDSRCESLFEGASSGTRKRFACTVAVYGCDRSGLAVATAAAGSGANVLVVGREESYLQSVADGTVPGSSTETFDAAMRSARSSGRLVPTTSAADAAEAAAVHVLATPPTARADGYADLSALRTFTRVIAPLLDAGDLVVLDTVVPPGTTRNTVGPVIEETSDVDSATVPVVHCARARNQQRPIRALRRGEQLLIGTLGDHDPTLPTAFYERLSIYQPSTAGSPTVTELVDLRNALRDSLLTGLDAELARLGDEFDADLADVIEAGAWDDERETGIGGDGRIDAWKALDGSLPAMVERESSEELPLLAGLDRTGRRSADAIAATVVRGLHATGQPPHDSSVLLLGVPETPTAVDTLESIASTLGSEGTAVYATDEDAAQEDHGLDTVSSGMIDRIEPAAAVLVTPRLERLHTLYSGRRSPPVLVDACGVIEEPIAEYTHRIGHGRIE